MGGKSAAEEANKEAERARRDEQRRQEAIRAGTRSINATFDGGFIGDALKPTGQALDFSSGEYYDANGTRLSGQLAKWDDEQVFSAPKQRAGQFNEDYYKKLGDNYLNYATPQLEQQYADAQEKLTFDLARTGQLDSSTRASKFADLQKLYDTNKQQVADTALSYGTQARSSVEDARADLIRTLNSTGDATGAATAAISRASALSQPQAYSPLTSLFGDFTSALGTQAAQERAAAASGGAYTSRYNTGLFGNARSVQVS